MDQGIRVGLAEDCEPAAGASEHTTRIDPHLLQPGDKCGDFLLEIEKKEFEPMFPVSDVAGELLGLGPSAIICSSFCLCEGAIIEWEAR